MLLNVNKDHKLYHKLLGEIKIVRVEAGNIYADTGTHGILPFPFRDFGKVLFVEKSHVKKSFNDENEYTEFCIEEEQVKEEQIIAKAIEEKRKQDIINKSQSESIRKERQQKAETDLKKKEGVENKRSDLTQSIKRDHAQEVKVNPVQEIKGVIQGLIDRTKEHIRGLPDLKIINEILKKHTNGKFNYSDPLEQQLYLLRYFYAYYYEYRKILDCICQHFQEINVVSVGCGSCIDALALKHAFKGPTGYLGIDCVKWAYELPLPTNCDFDDRITSSTEDYLKDATVLFFPKSLSDIENSEMNDIKQWIKKSKLTKDKICLAASFIYRGVVDDLVPTADQFKQFNEILSILLEKNYVLDELNSFMVKEKDDSNKKIWKLDKEMPIPSNLLDFFNGGMEKLCKRYNKNSVHCEVCEKTNGKYDNECRYILPKLSAAGMYYKGTILRRE